MIAKTYGRIPIKLPLIKLKKGPSSLILIKERTGE